MENKAIFCKGESVIVTAGDLLNFLLLKLLHELELIDISLCKSLKPKLPMKRATTD